MTAGLVLAAGQGTRMGRPKALVEHPAGGTLLEHALSVLREGGCDVVVAVVGAGGAQVAELAAGADVVVEAQDWAHGQAASLRAGLDALARLHAQRVVVHLVDLPDVTGAVVRRVLAASPAGPQALARATYRGVPGHPVVLGRDHWPEVMRSATGDRGARAYLAEHDHLAVECGDLAGGLDVDTPADLGG